jgi:rhamnose utilization protein RhaD (predicted bifunctional aldolase and dehydrogenase)
MSGAAVRALVPPPDLWDDAYAAVLDEPGLLIYRSSLLGADLHAANFGGGDALAKVDAVAPLTGETVDDAASKSTGDIVNVDAGAAVSFTR